MRLLLKREIDRYIRLSVRRETLLSLRYYLYLVASFLTAFSDLSFSLSQFLSVGAAFLPLNFIFLSDRVEHIRRCKDPRPGASRSIGGALLAERDRLRTQG